MQFSDNLPMSSNLPTEHQDSTQDRTLQVDFTWKGFKCLVSEKDDPESKPIYIVDYKTVKPQIVFKSAVDSSPFGSGTIHNISIDAECEIRGQHISINAMRRFKSEYTYLSRAFSDTDTPVAMTWTSACHFTTWDFVCLDRQQIPVARFSANNWRMAKVGNIEFLGPRAGSDVAREEILVTGLTFFHCMTSRNINILSFFGAIFSQPGGNNDKKSKSI